MLISCITNIYKYISVLIPSNVMGDVQLTDNKYKEYSIVY